MKVIYSIKNKINDYQYIGSTIRFKIRKSEHLNMLRFNKHHSDYLQKAWNKYGESSFEFIILEEVDDINQMLVREQFWIDTLNPQYNICKIAGNTFGKKCKKETKEKISLKHKGHSSELQKLAQIKRRKPVHQYELDGTFVKLWNSSQEAGLFLGKNHKSIIDCACGKSNAAYGYRWSYIDKPLRKIKRKYHKQIYQYTRENEFIKEWFTLSLAARFYNINSCNITECAKGHQKTSAGYIWRYERI